MNFLPKQIFALIILLSLLFPISTTLTLEVSVQQGRLAGTIETSRNGNKFYGFYSIPYAKPPIGSLRFEPPQEPEPWTGVRNAITNPPECIQKDYFKHQTDISGQEDCLYLNVFTRELQGNASTLVFIHGGAYSCGSSSLYPPTYIMDYPDVVLVTINYRLGVLGYLSAGDDRLPGNNGMKDQVAALKWIQKNIETFGGNPANVLIFGQSAGAASVHLHAFSPLSRGLFHKAFSLSGSALNAWATNPLETTKEYFKTISLLTGCSYKNTSDTVECLKQVPAEEFVKAQLKLFVRGIDPAITLGPTAEPDTVSEAFLHKFPKSGEELNHDIPWIFGQTSAEAIFIVNEYITNGDLKYLNNNYRTLFPIGLMFKPWLNPQFEATTAFTEYMKNNYLNGRDIDLNSIKQLTDLFSESIITFGITESAFGYKGRRYLYYMGYQRRSGPKLPYDDHITSLGVCHSEDLNFYFNVGNAIKNETDIDSEDYEISKNLIEMLIAFARTGNPNTNTNFTWKPVDDDLLSPHMHVANNSQFSLETGFFREKYDIFQNITKYLQR